MYISVNTQIEVIWYKGFPYCVVTVEAVLTDAVVSGQLYLRPLSQNPVFLNSQTNSVILHSRKRTAPVLDTFFTPGGCQEVKSEYRNVSASLKCVRISRIASLWNLLHVKTLVSGKVISFFEISVVNFIVG